MVLLQLNDNQMTMIDYLLTRDTPANIHLISIIDKQPVPVFRFQSHETQNRLCQMNLF